MSHFLSSSDDYMLTNNDGRDFYLSCGCWSGDADHSCTKPGADRCNGCGVPDDCYCHELCDDVNSNCYSCALKSVETDHADALVFHYASQPAHVRAYVGNVELDQRDGETTVHARIGQDTHTVCGQGVWAGWHVVPTITGQETCPDCFYL